MPYGRRKKHVPVAHPSDANEGPYKDIVFEWRQTTRLSNVFGNGDAIGTGTSMAGGGGVGAVAGNALYLNAPFDCLATATIPPQASAAWYDSVMDGSAAAGQPAGWRGHCVWGVEVTADWSLGEDVSAASDGQEIICGMFPSYGGVTPTATTLWGYGNQALMNFMYAPGIVKKAIRPVAIKDSGTVITHDNRGKGLGRTKAYWDIGKMLGSNKSLKDETLEDLRLAGLYSDVNDTPTTLVELNLFTMLPIAANTQAGAAFSYSLTNGYVDVKLRMYTRLYAQSNMVPGAAFGGDVVKQMAAVGGNIKEEDPMEEAEYEDEEEEAVVCASQAQGRHCTCGHGVDKTGCEA